MPRSHSLTGMILALLILAMPPAAAGAWNGEAPRVTATTTAQNAASITANPTRVVFGGTATISGTVTGQKAAGAEVTLELSQAPFTGQFMRAGAPVAADAAGNYSFTVTPQVNTRYRVRAKTKPQVRSSEVQVNVAPVVTFRVGDTSIASPRRIRFSGVVRPAHDGATARIQRRTSTGKYRTVATVVLRTSTTAGQSVYSRRVRVRRTSTYRVVLPADADTVTGRSRARRIRVT